MRNIIYFVNYSGLVESFFDGFHPYLKREGDTVIRISESGQIIGEYTAYTKLTDLANVLEQPNAQ